MLSCQLFSLPNLKFSPHLFFPVFPAVPVAASVGQGNDSATPYPSRDSLVVPTGSATADPPLKEGVEHDGECS